MLQVAHVVYGVFARDATVDKGPNHVVVGHAGHIARRIQTGDCGFGPLVDPDARGAVAAAQADFRDIHLDAVGAVAFAPAFVEAASAGAFVIPQNGFDFVDGVVVEVVHLQVHRAFAGVQLFVDLQHHLAAPVVAVDEPVALGVGGVSAEGAGHVGAGGAVVVFNQRVDLEALDVGELGPGVVGHGVAVARVGGVLVGAVEVARGGQTQATTGPGAEHNGLGLNYHHVAVAHVETHGPGDATVLHHDAGSHHPVGDVDLVALDLAGENFLQVFALGHGQHVLADPVHLLEVVVALVVFLKLDAPALQLLDHLKAQPPGFVDGFLVDNAIVGDGDFAHILLGGRVAGDDGGVDPVHAHGDRTTAANIRFL